MDNNQQASWEAQVPKLHEQSGYNILLLVMYSLLHMHIQLI